MTKPNNSKSTFFDFLGIAVYFIVYKFSDPNIAVRNAALSLIVVTVLIFIWFYLIKKQPMPRLMLAVNLITIFFALPSAYFNSLEFIKIKVIFLKVLLVAIPLVMLMFGKNMVKALFGSALDFQVSDSDWNKINMSFIITAVIGLIVSVYAALTMENDAYVSFKTFFLPIISSAYLLPFIYYIARAGIRAEKDKQKEKKEEASSQQVNKEYNITLGNRDEFEFTDKKNSDK